MIGRRTAVALMDVNSVWRSLSVRGYREDQQVILCHEVESSPQ